MASDGRKKIGYEAKGKTKKTNSGGRISGCKKKSARLFENPAEFIVDVIPDI